MSYQYATKYFYYFSPKKKKAATTLIFILTLLNLQKKIWKGQTRQGKRKKGNCTLYSNLKIFLVSYIEIPVPDYKFSRLSIIWKQPNIASLVLRIYYICHIIDVFLVFSSNHVFLRFSVFLCVFFHMPEKKPRSI